MWSNQWCCKGGLDWKVSFWRWFSLLRWLLCCPSSIYRNYEISLPHLNRVILLFRKLHFNDPQWHESHHLHTTQRIAFIRWVIKRTQQFAVELYSDFGICFSLIVLEVPFVLQLGTYSVPCRRDMLHYVKRMQCKQTTCSHFVRNVTTIIMAGNSKEASR